MKVKCLIVDDEPPACELLASYLEKLDDFEIVGQFANAFDAFTFLQRNHVDLMFLDIQMPQMNGVELVKALQSPPRFVFTTAFRNYALDGFDLDALDYLVKPITFARFMKAISKYQQYQNRTPVDLKVAGDFENAYLFIKVNRDQVKLFLKDILYIESIKDYLRIHTKDAAYVTYMRLSHLQEKLPAATFARIHKSFIVAVNAVESFRPDGVRVNNKRLPIGRYYKKSFMESFSIKFTTGHH